MAAASPLLPPLLLGRLVRQQLATQSTPREFAVALPFTVLFLVAWSAGELAGYLTGRE